MLSAADGMLAVHLAVSRWQQKLNEKVLLRETFITRSTVLESAFIHPPNPSSSQCIVQLQPLLRTESQPYSNPIQDSDMCRCFTRMNPPEEYGPDGILALKVRAGHLSDVVTLNLTISLTAHVYSHVPIIRDWFLYRRSVFTLCTWT